MNAFDTRQGQEFLDGVPTELREIVATLNGIRVALEENNRLQRELLERLKYENKDPILEAPEDYLQEYPITQK